MRMKEDYKFIRGIFKEYKFSYSDLFNETKNVEYETIIWSDSYLEFYPYQNALNQLTKPKIYKTEPESKESVIVNKLKDDEVYYSYRAENEGWGSVFIINKDHAKICLMFFNNDDDEIVLGQVYYIIYKSEFIIDKVLFYSMDEDIDGDKELDEQTFMIDEYLYNENDTIDSITRNGFYETKKNVLAERKFRFEYSDNKFFIYSKQLKKNNSDIEELSYVLKKESTKQ